MHVCRRDKQRLWVPCPYTSRARTVVMPHPEHRPRQPRCRGTSGRLTQNRLTSESRSQVRGTLAAGRDRVLPSNQSSPRTRKAGSETL